MIYRNYPFFTVLFFFAWLLSTSVADVVYPTPRYAADLNGSRKNRKLSPQIKLIEEDCQLSDSTRQQIETGIQFLYDFYRRKLGYDFPRDFSIKIRVFDKFPGYKRYQHRVALVSQSNTGFYVNTLKEAVVFKGKSEQQFLAVLFHETNHVLLRNRIGNCPKWINEGLSEYFEGMEFSGTHVMVRPQTIKDDRTKRWLETNNLPNVFTYLTKSNQEWNQEDDRSPNPRTVAWSFVYFLMANDDGQLVIRDLLDYMAQHQNDPYVSVRAMDQFYPGGYRKFEKEWTAWLAAERQEQVVDTRPIIESKFRRLIRNVTMWLS